jgi:hypothetical protein
MKSLVGKERQVFIYMFWCSFQVIASGFSASANQLHDFEEQRIVE